MDTHFILIVLHIVATILGVGGATMIEIHLNKALRDGTMDAVERSFLGSDFYVTRVGMTLGFLTGMGFVIEYWMYDQLFRLNSGVFWAKMTIFLIIVVNAYLLHKHKIGLYWGSAFSFVSWWTVMFLGMFLSNSVAVLPGKAFVSFLLVMLMYGVTVMIGAQLLHMIRERLKAQFVRGNTSA